MAAKINKNRYRLITLLYVIFVCISVLNIPASLLDSNYYSIKTLEYQESERAKQIIFANKVIKDSKKSLNSDSILNYLFTIDKIRSTYKIVDQLDKTIISELAKQNTSVFKEFNNTRKIENILTKDSSIYNVKKELFLLHSYIAKSKLVGISRVIDIVPIKELIISQSGKEIEWERYFFLHKPAAISYMQVKRLKLLLLDLEYIFLIELLKKLDYSPAFYSEKDKMAYVDSSKRIINTTSFDKSDIDSSFKVNMVDNEKINSKKISPELAPTDSLIQKLVASFHFGTFYLGLQNKVLTNLDSSVLRDFSISIEPGAVISSDKNSYYVNFNKTGDYVLKFFDKRNNSNTLLFERKVSASILPNPTVKINSDNLSRDVITVKDLLRYNRLIGNLDIKDYKGFPGRINGYRVTRIRAGDQQSIYNYGEIFQSQVQALLSNVTKGDIILFDNITVYLSDGTTRTPSPILYKIAD